ncbi:hypothetical protein A0H81_06826 [Grifola frondosa]|uniref:Uncharacterized protein n=1 Tax=Grifola frondosa TaxID=5627 RepID=A0A1C7M7Y2_GRIFR|nr:hypothetical protein A0H81_06826 [Grifola frondosa]
MNDYFQQIIEGKIDFEGQKVVERIVKTTLISATAVSFILGFASQSLRHVWVIRSVRARIICCCSASVANVQSSSCAVASCQRVMSYHICLRLLLSRRIRAAE